MKHVHIRQHETYLQKIHPHELNIKGFNINT